MNSRLFSSTKPNISDTYSFLEKEQLYSLFRPKWSNNFALATLQQAGIQFHENPSRWSGLHNEHNAPIIICIGSGAGADPEAFLKAGCIVYAVEPNAELRMLAESRLSSLFPQQFFSINGNAHDLNLPADLIADVIVCAQALHTFSSEINNMPTSEAYARNHWRKHIPHDNRDRLAVWYYNLDPRTEKILDLHKLLQSASASYSSSKTPLVNAEMFEPIKIQHYIHAADMKISTAQPVDKKYLNFSELMQWLKSYSFFPKTDAEINFISNLLRSWFDNYKNSNNQVEINYIGFITQGPIRATPFFNDIKHFMPEKSPITTMKITQDNTPTPFWQNRRPQVVLRAIL